MTPCTTCGCHVLDADRSCPHCGSPRSSGTTRAAVLLTLAMVACFPKLEPEYGAPYIPPDTTETGADADTDADSDSDTDADTDADSDADSDSGGSGTSGGSAATASR